MMNNRYKKQHKKMENIRERSRINKANEIIRQVKEGEQKAQFQLYKYYFNTMYKTSLDIVKDEGKAEDVLNEAFLHAFDKIDTYDTQEDFDHWLENFVVYQSKNELNSADHHTKKDITQKHHTTHTFSVFAFMLKRKVKSLFYKVFKAARK
jgi:DNA-directed RNA polymerase specialized sigma24 family protein